MAQSRLEKVGTIYSRVCSLLKTGAMKEENKPMWLDIYKSFPPKYDPHFDRKVPDITVKQIFYAEDVIRARFHKDYKNYSMVNLLDSTSVSKTEQFINIYKQLEREGIPEERLYAEAVQEFLSKYKAEKPQREEDPDRSIPRPKFVRTKGTRKESKSAESEITKESVEQSAEDDVQYKPIKLRLDKIMKEGEENDSSKKSS